MNTKTNFFPTHFWKQYTNIEFEINENKIRVKGNNDKKPSNWVNIYTDINGIKYFNIQHEKIYWFDIITL